MFTTAGWKYPLLLLLGLPALLLTPLAGPASDIKPPVSRLIDTAVPEPPHQRDAWEAPPSKVPNEFVTAVWLLFQQGFADPRGCEYREIEVRADNGVAPTHGWVLPARRGDERRYAVCWNGLVYTLVSCGNKADLADDVRGAIDRMKDGTRPEPGWQPKGDEGWAVWHKTLDSDRSLRGALLDYDLKRRLHYWRRGGDSGGLATALLLRLGEGELASAWWSANHPPQTYRRNPPPAKHPYVALWCQFGRAWLQRVLAAHRRGDDSLALSDARRLTAFAKAAFAQAQALVPDGALDQRSYVDYLQPLPAVLADQERRAREGPHPAVVCVGPGRHPDAATRIAALIARLDEVDTYTRLSFRSDAGTDDRVLGALIREGEPALEPLLRCYADDERLTRVNYYSAIEGVQESLASVSCLTVRQAVLDAVKVILERMRVEPFYTSDLFRNGATPAQVAAAIRKHVKTAKRRSEAEDCFQCLADDAQPNYWASAANWLTQPVERERPRATLWYPKASGVARDRRQLPGDPLRDKVNPSVTELLLRRIGQAKVRSGSGVILAEALGEWEPQSALEPLARQMHRLRQTEECYDYVRCVEAQCKLGDEKALDDYVVWVVSLTPKDLRDSGDRLFGPMMRYPDHPGMAAAAETLFGHAPSPWLPLTGHSEGSRISELIPSGLLRVPAFRKAVLKELANKGGEGTVEAERSGAQSIHLPGVVSSSGGGWNGRQELDIPEGGVKGKFRICDYVASIIGERFEGAPRCELYWSEAKRDAAVRDCAAFLRRYGEHLFAQPDTLRNDHPATAAPDTLKRDRPATAADVRAGRAIFSLADEGETRMVPGVDWTLPARWTTLQNRPYITDETDPLTGHTIFVRLHRQDGRVVQAEEVLKDGEWRRFYGFVGSNQIARVPAEEIEFPPEQGWHEPREWVRVGAGLHARLEVPPLQVELIDDYPPRLPADAALTFGLVVRNGRGVEQLVPVLDKSVWLRLLYSPETVSRQGALVPQATRDTEWTELKPQADAAFQAEKGKSLAVVEERKLATFDLRQWFGVSKPGFYRLQLLPAVQEAGAVPEVSEVRFSLAPSER